MPLSPETRRRIEIYLEQEVTRYVHENAQALPVLESQPFHARLMPALFKETGITMSERSFSTRLGLWFQRLAEMVAVQFNQAAERNFLVQGQLQPAAEATVTGILAQMENNTRQPNRTADVAQVLGQQFPNGALRQVRSDLRILRHDGRELFFEMKTVKPNKN